MFSNQTSGHNNFFPTKNFIALLVIITGLTSCSKRNDLPLTTSLICKYEWYPYKVIDSSFNISLDTLYQTGTILEDTCDTESPFIFNPNGNVIRKYHPNCIIVPPTGTPNQENGTWNVSSDSTFYLSLIDHIYGYGVHYLPSLKLVYVDDSRLVIHQQFSFSSLNPPQSGIVISTLYFRHN